MLSLRKSDEDKVLLLLLQYYSIIIIHVWHGTAGTRTTSHSRDFQRTPWN
jgi:hypothetical protein